MAEKAITADDIRKALGDYYREPEWYLGFEVGNGTGCECTRHADAVAVNAYPSRGFEVRGFEIKVSRSDLKSELENGAKAEAVAKYCNYWFLVVPKGLTKDMMIPEPWGIIEYFDGKLRQKKPAKFRERLLDHGFMIAFIRGVQRATSEEIAAELARLQAQAAKMLDSNVQWQLKEFDELKKQMDVIYEKTGIHLTRWGLDRRNLTALKIAHNIVKSQYSEEDIDYHVNRLNEIAGVFKEVCASMKALSGLEGTADIK